jgi:hypothetical protein
MGKDGSVGWRASNRDGMVFIIKAESRNTEIRHAERGKQKVENLTVGF